MYRIEWLARMSHFRMRRNRICRRPKYLLRRTGGRGQVPDRQVLRPVRLLPTVREM